MTEAGDIREYLKKDYLSCGGIKSALQAAEAILEDSSAKI